MGKKDPQERAGGRFGRRRFLKLAGGAVGGLAASSVFTRLGISPDLLVGATGRQTLALAAIPGGTLNPLSIPKYVRQLVIPPAMPQTVGGSAGIDYYEIAVRQFRQEIVPGLQTTVWSYGSVQHPATFNYPAFSIEADVGTAVRVKWINGLVDGNGDFLPHLLPVDRLCTGPTPREVIRVGICGRRLLPLRVDIRARSRWSCTCTGPTAPKSSTVTPRHGTCPPRGTSQHTSRR